MGPDSPWGVWQTDSYLRAMEKHSFSGLVALVLFVEDGLLVIGI